MARIKETELAAKLIAWLQSQGHKHLHEEVKVSGVGTADVVSCDSYITVYECKVDKPGDLVLQCKRWHGLAHAIFAVSANPIAGTCVEPCGNIVVPKDGRPYCDDEPLYCHDYNAEPIRSACNEHNAVDGAFAKAGSKSDKRATAENVKWRRASEVVLSTGLCTVGYVAMGIGVTPLKLIEAVKNGLVPNVSISPMSGKSYLVYNP